MTVTSHIIPNTPYGTELSHTRYCSECKVMPIEGRAITCSARCRKERQRRKQKARLAMPLAMHELFKIQDSLKRREDVEMFMADLQRLKAEINDLLLLAGEKDALAKREMFEVRARRNS